MNDLQQIVAGAKAGTSRPASLQTIVPPSAPRSGQRQNAVSVPENAF